MTPTFVYGTAWKKERTTECVELALSNGFRAIDTANQPRHYQEDLVGRAIRNGGLDRKGLWLQTKFTPADGQDERIPYDPSAGYGTQVEQSFQSSLEHLNADYVDSYLLHGPYTRHGLTDADLEVWSAMEAIQKEGRTKEIGISNVTAEQLELLVEKASIPPKYVQNRCFAVAGWDREVRELCRKQGIVYQGFSLLTANAYLVEHPHMVQIAQRHRLTIAQTIFAFARQIGILPLTGTTSSDHMTQDLASLSAALSADEVEQIHTLAG